MKCSDPNCCYDQCAGHTEVKPLDYTHEHQKVKSRLTGKNVEIAQGPMPAAADPSKGGLVPANPFVSASQRAYLNMRPDILGKAKLDEFNKASKGLHLPKHVKK